MWCPECRASHPYNCGHKIHVDATCLDWRDRAGARPVARTLVATSTGRPAAGGPPTLTDVTVATRPPEHPTREGIDSIPERIDAAVRRYEAARNLAPTGRTETVAQRLVQPPVSQRRTLNTEQSTETARGALSALMTATRRASTQEVEESLPFFNDDGARLAFGRGGCAHKYYCGRALGRLAIPGSDGRCGPNNGPQCRSCRRVVNDEGARTTISRVNGVVHYYCGRTAPPGSESICGPDGAQCPSCMRHQALHVTALHQSMAAHL
mmetsp:Transcript_26656/g.61313  ORF Transcript_26656/g.61313 Transcript_26656/m.61313 type:complete len:266 (+) Transcript_26656:54-851(+)